MISVAAEGIYIHKCFDHQADLTSRTSDAAGDSAMFARSSYI